MYWLSRFFRLCHLAVIDIIGETSFGLGMIRTQDKNRKLQKHILPVDFYQDLRAYR